MSLASPVLRLFAASLLAAACGLNTFGPGAALGSSSGGEESSTSSGEEPTTGTTSAGDGSCGNGVLDGAAEECDDGDDDDHNACTNACKVAFCGDGLPGPGEQCDDGDSVDDDECDNLCIETFCGDGKIQQGEDCDEHGVDTARCDADCSTPLCGDRRWNQAAEACDDDGESLACNDDCTAAECGDGKLNASAGEACDDGNKKGGDGCSLACTPTVVEAVVAGLRHVCVRFETGVVRCWGNGAAGKLGSEQEKDIGDEPEELPAPDVSAGDVVVQLCAGGEHTCAREAADGVRCWGSGQNGKLGYGDTFDRGDGRGEMPTPLLELSGPVSEVACGGVMTCARTLDDTVHCWGSPFAYGDAMARGDIPGELPTPALPGLVDIAQISLGDSFGCARTGGGQVFCWGDNDNGQLGQESLELIIGDELGEVPVSPTEVGGEVQQIAAGSDHVCAILEGGKVRCWGDNAFGQLGYGDTVDVGRLAGDMPSALVDIGGTAEQIVAGSAHTCVLSTTGKVRCWGAGNYGQLGNMSEESIGDDPGEMPPDPIDLGGDAVALSSHLGSFTCALLVDGTLRCWGSNLSGQLGYGHTESVGDDETPAMAGPVPF